MVVSDTRLRRTPVGVTSLGLRVGWCPKCRRRILRGPVAWRLEELMVQIAAENGRESVASGVMPDYVHLFVRARSIDSAPPTAKLLKGEHHGCRARSSRGCAAIWFLGPRHTSPKPP
jgi:putative transposase